MEAAVAKCLSPSDSSVSPATSGPSEPTAHSEPAGHSEPTAHAEPAAHSPPKPKAHRGFAAMNREAHRLLASAGGKSAHAYGLAHRFTPEQAREAGKKGGAKTAEDRAHMAEIGRKGGIAKGESYLFSTVGKTPKKS